MASPRKRVREIMATDIVSLHEETPQEEVSRVFSQNDLMAIPVVDEQGHIKGIVTVDDVVGVMQEEATEDIQKIGAVEALEGPYMQTSFLEMIKKRAGWLIFLFLGESLTATAMGYFEGQIAKAVVLALFIPLIISSGGNSGSQASTLIIRAIALREVRLRDWWRVFIREVSAGLTLGVILGAVGLLRVMFWPARLTIYGEHYEIIALTIGISLIGVVLWGTLAGSMLPFILRRLGADPATASAPLVATLVDVTGLIIYFSVAHVILSGVLL
jgi:magnesium transporter